LWSVNPRKVIDQDSRDVVELFARCLGAYGEVALMPYAGGVADQPALLLDAFDVIAPIWRAETKRRAG
jgi:hypothetical protein